MKKWLQWNPDRNGTIRLLLILAAILGVFAAVEIYAPDIQYRSASAGFGPDWQCTPRPEAIRFASRSPRDNAPSV
jgi:hypothetical protein